MKVDSISITGDLYEYSNSSNTVLKSDYGVFVFTREGELEGFEGRIPPYMIEQLEDETHIRSDVEIDAYSTEDNILFPLYKTDEMEPWNCFVIDGETVVQFGEIKQTNRKALGKELEEKQFVEIHSLPLVRGRVRTAQHYVTRDAVREVFNNNLVERVFVV